jgi:WD40 repeat protein
MLTGHAASATSIAFSPDSRLLASGSLDRTVRLWGPQTGTVERVLSGHLGAVRGVAFAPDGKTLASGGAVEENAAVTGGEIRLWNPHTGKLRAVIGGLGSVNALGYSPDGRLLAAACQDGIRLWNTASSTPARVLTTRPSLSLAFRPDSLALAGGSPDGKIEVWSLKTGDSVQVLKVGNAQVYAVAYEHGRSSLAATGPDGSVARWDASLKGEQRALSGHLRSVLALAWSREGGLLAVGSGQLGEKGLLKVWAPPYREPVDTLQEGRAITGVAFSPDGALLAIANEDGVVRLLDVGR